MLPIFVMHSFNKKKMSEFSHWLVMLSTAPALFRQCRSRAKVTAASRDLAAIRDPFIGPAHLTKPERLPMLERSIYEGVAYCAMSHF